jgi:hypothetical protein
VYAEFIKGRGALKLKKAAICILSILALIILLQNIDIYPVKKFADDRRAQREMFRDYTEQPLELLQRGSGVWGSIEAARAAIGIVEKNRWSFFKEK